MEEEEANSEDDFVIVTPAAPVVTANVKKTEENDEDGDSEEDEDDWEEVEGKRQISFLRRMLGMIKQEHNDKIIECFCVLIRAYGAARSS